MRLVADAMLGRLAKWLRALGFDTLYWRGDDAGLLRLAIAEGRLLLTRDTRLHARMPPAQCVLIETDHGILVAGFGDPQKPRFRGERPQPRPTVSRPTPGSGQDTNSGAY